MKRFHANVGSRNPALEKRPEILKPVGVDATVYVLSRMVNYLMRVVRCQSIVGHKRIAVERSASGDMLANFFLQDSLATAGNDGSANLSAALKDAHDGGLVLRSGASDAPLAFTQVHVSRFAANEGFVYFNFAAQLGAEKIVLHRKANPLKHEPCRLLGNLHVAGDLVAANTVLAIGKHPRCHEPLVQRDRRILIDRANLGGELALGMMATAFPSAP